MRPGNGIRATTLRRGKPLEPGPGPVRKAPLARAKGLQPSVPWARTVPMSSAGRWAQPADLEGKSAARKTGATTCFSRSVKLAVRTRAGNGDLDLALCEACGRWLGRRHGECQHIVARGMGGTSDPLLSTTANAALLCRGCHSIAESRDREMGARGFWLPQGTDPRMVPMMLASEHGSGVLVWRSEDGRYLTEPPEGAVA